AIRDGAPLLVREAAEAEAKASEASEALPPAREQAIEAVGVDPLELAIGFGLVPLVDQKAGGALLARVSGIRRQIAGELGMVIPPVRIHDELGLDSHEYVMKVRGGVVARGRIMPGHQLAMDSGEAVGQLPG